ncbi:MAG TPA: hypothetical protein VFM63_01670 [Pyrinomonadaceae bacterium]|nr:hypothetical protein [Pyrinomonadaceae bacterium]
MLSNIFFGPLAVMGYLVGDLGDAAGEPAGLKWGKHTYRKTKRFNKTLEGSVAVLAASTVALAINVAISPQMSFGQRLDTSA